MSEWSSYYEATQDKPLHPLLAELSNVLPPEGVALDLGCGTGIASRMLLDHGLEVIAVDSEEEAFERMGDLPVEKTLADLASYVPPPCDVAVAQFSLFFLPQTDFLAFWDRLVKVLKPGGLFCGQILGVNDDWAKRGYSVFDAEGVSKLLADLDVLSYEEAERDGETAMREPKHWHVFHIIARKRA